MRQNGDALRAIRRAKGLTLADLAKRVGVTESHMCHVEKENRHASQQLLDKAAAEMAVPVKAIMRGLA